MSDMSQEELRRMHPGPADTPQRPDERDGGRILLTAVARAVVILLERTEPRPHPRNVQKLMEAIATFGEESTND